MYVISGNTTNMAAHLKADHPEVVAKDTEPSQPKIAAFAEKKFPLPRAKSVKIDEALLRFIVKTLVPISLVDKPAFRAFVKELNDQYDLPCAKTVTTRLQEKHRSMEKQLKKELDDTEFAAITHDSWTSIATESYETVTVHFLTSSISAEWELRSKVLQTTKIDGSHTAEVIAGFLQDVKRHWGLKEVIAVSDNAAVEVKTFSILGWPRVGCFGHLVNLIVRSMLNEKRPRTIVAKGRNLVSYMNRSPLATSLFQKKQKLLLDKELHHSLINDVVTRWNSTVEMLNRLCEQMPALHALANDKEASARIKDLRPFLYNFQEQLIVEGLIKILVPFKKASELLSAEKNVTLSYVLAVLDQLNGVLAEDTSPITDEDNDDDEAEANHHLAEIKSARALIEKLKEGMRKDVKRRFEFTDLHEIASMLDPATKNWVCTKFQHDAVKDRLIKLLVDQDRRSEPAETATVIKQEPTDDLSQTPTPALPSLNMPADHDDSPIKVKLSPETKKAKVELADWLGDVLFVKEEKTPAKQDPLLKFQQEVDLYLSDEVKKEDLYVQSSTLGWWAEKERLYPNLARLAKKYLAIPASSVPSERIWSLAGNIVTKKRASIKSENLNMMIFLNHNDK